ncbi:MAG: SAM-dependent methyltransferase, partial [Hyphomicrobiales bacterium]
MNMVFPVADPVTPLAAAPAVLTAANLLLPLIERGERIDAATLRAAMETTFGASDATGAWDWKLAYEACEV